MSKVHGKTILTFPDGSERRIANSDILQLLADVTSPAAAPLLAMFKECTSARSTNGGRLHELVLAYIHGPVSGPDAPPFDLDDQEERQPA